MMKRILSILLILNGTVISGEVALPALRPQRIKKWEKGYQKEVDSWLREEYGTVASFWRIIKFPPQDVLVKALTARLPESFTHTEICSIARFCRWRSKEQPTFGNFVQNLPLKIAKSFDLFGSIHEPEEPSGKFEMIFKLLVDYACNGIDVQKCVDDGGEK